MKGFFLCLCFIVTSLQAQSSLSVEQIMQDPNWMGTFPSNLNWSANSQRVYFNYNPEQHPADSLYAYDLRSNQLQKVKVEDAQMRIPQNAITNLDQSLQLFTRKGNLWVYDQKKDQQKLLLDLPQRINSYQFLTNQRIAIVVDANVYVAHLESLQLQQLTYLAEGQAPATKDTSSEKDQWVKNENLNLLKEIQTKEANKAAQKTYINQNSSQPQPYYLGKERPYNFKLSPNAQFLTFQTYVPSSSNSTIVPDFTDVSGYTTNLRARAKVGDQDQKTALYLYHINTHNVIKIDHTQLPEIDRLPAYTNDYPERDWKNTPRPVTYSEVYFSKDSKQAVVDIRTQDNKDRYISLINLDTGELQVVDHQHDEAWIGGPGINAYYNGGTLGWLPDHKHLYYQSEVTGYSHLYLYNTTQKRSKALTSGKFEVFSPQLSANGQHWYFTASIVHPGERHFYKMPVYGGEAEQLTHLKGNNQVRLSPDEKYLAIRYSNSNTPWELYLKRNKSKAEAQQITSGQSKAFKAYNWRTPELIQFKAKDGAKPYARLYRPNVKQANGAAIIFVHGAGYLQNAHYWWSSYFREYMFHNLLTDLGYTVLDIDYRGSAGYGRDWRTGIYRHMGGKDLSDQVDGANFLAANYGIDKDKIGIYGGSYGGFITLMALFNEADTFAAGAALRSVTDWAHYNHTYTKNILNEPHLDPIAYRRSSPIYFAEGLEDPLLIAHGMLDTNVHYQDVVRLAQRLIELKKERWEMAVYPVEGHGFTQPSSWTDEYKRILTLFETNIRN